jgi:hypothetical protein
MTANGSGSAAMMRARVLVWSGDVVNAISGGLGGFWCCKGGKAWVNDI